MTITKGCKPVQFFVETALVSASDLLTANRRSDSKGPREGRMIVVKWDTGGGEAGASTR
jgi:hypothetical protein